MVPWILSKLTWRAVPAIMLDAEELSGVLYSTYQSMFESERMSKTTENLKNELVPGRLYYFPCFHRGSFAHLLRAVQANSSDWKTTITNLLDLMRSDQDIMLTEKYMQELYLYLHLLGLSITPAINDPLSVQPSFGQLHNFWPSCPGIVWLTVKVPRSHLRHVTPPNIKPKSIPVHGIVETASTLGQNYFASIQMIFGEIKTTGSMETLRVLITEDAAGFGGNASLVISFQVPSWILMIDQGNPKVGFGAQDTMHTFRGLAFKLGPELKIFMTDLRNSSNVFITKTPPNSSSEASAEAPIYVTRIDSNIRGTITNGKLQTTVARINIELENEKAALLGGSEVALHQATPWEFELNFANYKHRIELPAPASASRCKVRIARKSGFLELVASPLSPEDYHTLSPFPISIKGTAPRLLNVTRTNLDLQPAIDTSGGFDWLSMHTLAALSAAESEYIGPDVMQIATPLARFKISLLSMYSALFEKLSENTRPVRRVYISSIDSPAAHMGILVNELRLDLSGRTVLIDAAIFSPVVMGALGFLRAIPILRDHPLLDLKFDDAQVKVWKQVIPAYIERCRAWSHSDTCEYRREGKLPLSYNPREAFFCSCGAGIFPKNYLSWLPNWSTLAPYCIRAAISPCFDIPYVNEVAHREPREENLNKCSHCQKASEDGKALKECGQCHVAKYCSRECQKKDWPKHKSACKKQ